MTGTVPVFFTELKIVLFVLMLVKVWKANIDQGFIKFYQEDRREESDWKYELCQI